MSTTSTTVAGIIGIVAGIVFCFRGYGALRVIIPIWAAFVGFFLGAGVVASQEDGSYLHSPASWITGIALALIFAALAYAYYAVAVILAMGSAGFAVGSSVVMAFGMTWNWVVVLIGVAVGLLLALFAIVTDLPMLLLVVAGALAGASAIIFGIMMLAGYVGTEHLDGTEISNQLSDHWWFYPTYIVLAVIGIISQLRVERAHATMRAGWAPER